MKLITASLAGKISNSERNFVSHEILQAQLYEWPFILVFSAPVCLLQETVSQVKIMLIPFSHPYANTCFILRKKCA